MSRSERGQCGLAVRTRSLLTLGALLAPGGLSRLGPAGVGGLGLMLSCSIDDRTGSVVSDEGENGDSRAPTAPEQNVAIPIGAARAGAGGAGDQPERANTSAALPLSPGAAGNAAPEASGASNSSPADPAAAAAAGAAGEPGAPQEAVGGCFQQLLVNAGFEAGHSAWSEVSELRDVIVARDDPGLVAAGVAPQSGAYLAWIGGVPNTEFLHYATTLRQDVPIPADALSLTLSGYAWVSQRELGNMPFDWAVLEAVDPDPNSQYLWQAKLFSDADVTGGWQYFETTTTAIGWMLGRTVTVQVDARPMGNGSLSVWLDSLRLEARCAR